MTIFAISEWAYRDNLTEAINFELLFLPSRLIAVYLNWYILIPWYLYKNKLWHYSIGLLVVLILTGVGYRYLVIHWGYPTFFPDWTTNSNPLNLPRLLQSILVIVAPVAFTTGGRLFYNWYTSQKEAETLLQQKNEAELKFLKAQTNPHFLFNTLNSIYGLALEKSDKTPELILKLSDILSYTLYESGSELIPVSKELKLIEDIMELGQERFGKRVQIRLDKSGDFDKVEIPPLILIPFVENAFKHGLKQEVDQCHIHIDLEVKDIYLSFQVENTISDDPDPEEKSGLGLKNIRRRLDLIYGTNYSLKISENEEIFKVVLNINF